jgi:hypothetical protein
VLHLDTSLTVNAEALSRCISGLHGFLDPFLCQLAFHLQEAKAQQMQEKYSKSKEKNAVLKENNRILTEQVQQLQESYDTLASESERKEQQLTSELKLVSQVHDAPLYVTCLLATCNHYANLASKYDSAPLVGKTVSFTMLCLQILVAQLMYNGEYLANHSGSMPQFPEVHPTSTRHGSIPQPR